MNSDSVLCLTLGVLFITNALAAPTPLSSGHLDLGVGYEDGALDLHVHDEENDTEYSPADALLVVNPAALQFSPGGAYEFLGPAGTPNWILPATDTPGLLFLGIGGEELDSSDWAGNLTFRLESVAGPGSFYLWSVNPFGQPEVFMDSSNPQGVPGEVTVTPGRHEDYNWGFSAPGTYRIAFEAAGVNVTDGPQNSGPVTFQFEVVPEPETWTLLVLGAIAVAGACRRRAGLKRQPFQQVPLES